MKGKGDKPKKPIDRLTKKQRSRLLIQSGLDEIDIAEEVREGPTTSSEAELGRIREVREKLVTGTAGEQELSKEKT